MNGDVFQLTLRMLLGRRRTLILGLFSLIPVLLALAFRLSDPADENPVEWAANALLEGTVITFLLPLAALVFGTAAFGAEAEDGTVVYILARPLQRWTIVTAKLAAAAVATGVLVLPAAIVSAFVVATGEEDLGSLLAGFTAGMVAAIVAYAVLFLCLGILTGRAFIAGLAYVFIWEGVITNIFSGTRLLSIREAALGIAAGIAGLPETIYEADVSLATGLIILLAVVAVAMALGIRGAQRYEFGEGG